MKVYSVILKAPVLEPHHHMLLSVKARIYVGGYFTLLQRCSQHILQPRPTGRFSIDNYRSYFCLLIKIISILLFEKADQIVPRIPEGYLVIDWLFQATHYILFCYSF